MNQRPSFKLTQFILVLGRVIVPILSNESDSTASRATTAGNKIVLAGRDIASTSRTRAFQLRRSRYEMLQGLPATKRTPILLRSTVLPRPKINDQVLHRGMVEVVHAQIVKNMV